MAANTRRGWQPDWAVVPGDILLDALDERGMSQAELARRMNRPLKTINEIVKGKAAITPETAIQLELVLGITASIWNDLETRYREHIAQVEAQAHLEREANEIKKFPVKDMIRHKMLAEAPSDAEQWGALLRFFGVSSSSGWINHWQSVAASFRQSSAFSVSPEAVAVWLRWGELEAAKMECESFNADQLHRALPTIRGLTRLAPLAFQSDIVDVLKECGVAFIITPEISGTRLSGGTRWLSPLKVVVQVSLRHRRDDQFWFSVFHELGHVVRGYRRQAYLDLDSGTAILDREEELADEFARQTLVPDADYERIRHAPELTREYIREEALRLDISPGIIVGRLQRDRVIAPTALNDLKRRFQWADEVYK